MRRRKHYRNKKRLFTVFSFFLLMMIGFLSREFPSLMPAQKILTDINTIPVCMWIGTFRYGRFLKNI